MCECDILKVPCIEMSYITTEGLILSEEGVKVPINFFKYVRDNEVYLCESLYRDVT